MIITEQESLPSIVPDYYKQRQIVLPALRESLAEGAVWRLIPFKWFDLWKTIAEKDENSRKCPPLDISILFENGKLKENLMEQVDYAIVPENVYEKLDEWHGKKRKIQTLSLIFIFRASVESFLRKRAKSDQSW